MSMARLGSAFPPFSVSPSSPFHPMGFPSCVSDGGAQRPSRPKVVHGVRKNGPPGPPAGPTLRETVEELRGRGQLTAVLGEVLEITALVFVMYSVFSSGFLH